MIKENEHLGNRSFLVSIWDVLQYPILVFVWYLDAILLLNL